MTVTFYNVKVSVEAETPHEAYDKLCEALSRLDPCEWTTDTYGVYDSTPGKEACYAGVSTEGLFPESEDQDKTMDAKPHCVKCGCDLQEGICPEGCSQE